MKIEPGLLIAIPLAEKVFGFGQLIAWQKPIFYMVGYDLKAEIPTLDEQEIIHASPIFMGNFFDVLIKNGRWLSVKKLGIPDVPFPCFKFKIGDKFYVESWDRKQKREATAEECASLQFRTNHSPIILENVLKAHFGFAPWEAKWFESLKVEEVVKQSKFF